MVNKIPHVKQIFFIVTIKNNKVNLWILNY